MWKITLDRGVTVVLTNSLDTEGVPVVSCSVLEFCPFEPHLPVSFQICPKSGIFEIVPTRLKWRVFLDLQYLEDFKGLN
jgi:hypothetical protein